MSEFTDGFVLLAADKDKLEASLKALDEKGISYILHQLNDKYLGLFIDFTTHSPIFYGWIARCSEQLPIMYFGTHDEGWEYMLYTNGQVTSQISVLHALEEHMVIELLEQELGPNDGIDFYAHNDTDAYREKVLASRAYKQAIKAMYSQLNLRAFKAFGLDKNEIKQLKALLSPSFYGVYENGRWKQKSEFQEIIGIREMEWKSYRYLKRDQDEGKSND